jgi:guanine deaminase
MAEVGASVAACPLVNIKSFAVVPVPRFHALGLKIGLGTDIAGGYAASMLAVSRIASLANRSEQYVPVQRVLPPGETEWKYFDDAKVGPVDWKYAMHLGTVGGAKALGLDKEISTIDVGKQFDAVLVDVDAENQPFEYWPDDDILKQVERYFNTGDDRNVAKVWVQGRCVVGA